MKKYFFLFAALLPLLSHAQVASTGTLNTVTSNPTNPVVAPAQVAGTLMTTGVAVLPGGLLSNGKTTLSDLLNRYAEDNRYQFFEVSEDMFKAFCELENADSTTIALFKKIKSVKMLEIQYTPKEIKEMEKNNEEAHTPVSWFYSEFTSELDLTGYNQLLKSSNNRSLALFLKKEHGPADNEFLLITDKMVIDIRGDIKVKTIYQMEEMMSYVQQILPN
jgi:hypothetical protein